MKRPIPEGVELPTTNPTQISTSAVDPKDALIRELVGALQQWEDAMCAAMCHDGVHIELVSEVAQASRKEFDTLALARTTCPEAFDGCSETTADGR